VTAALKIMGLENEKRYTNYHRVLNRAKWDALNGAKILLAQGDCVISFFIHIPCHPSDGPAFAGGITAVEQDDHFFPVCSR
jgi:hypothetical protein